MVRLGLININIAIVNQLFPIQRHRSLKQSLKTEKSRQIITNTSNET